MGNSYNPIEVPALLFLALMKILTPPKRKVPQIIWCELICRSRARERSRTPATLAPQSLINSIGFLGSQVSGASLEIKWNPINLALNPLRRGEGVAVSKNWTLAREIKTFSFVFLYKSRRTLHCLGISVSEMDKDSSTVTRWTKGGGAREIDINLNGN